MTELLSNSRQNTPLEYDPYKQEALADIIPSDHETNPAHDDALDIMARIATMQGNREQAIKEIEVPSGATPEVAITTVALHNSGISRPSWAKPWDNY